jgi:hypothetical protein
VQWAIVDIDALDASIDALRIARISAAIAFVSDRARKGISAPATKICIHFGWHLRDD